MASEWKIDKSFATIGRLTKYLDEWKKDGWNWESFKITKCKNEDRFYLDGIIKDY